MPVVKKKKKNLEKKGFETDRPTAQFSCRFTCNFLYCLVVVVVDVDVFNPLPVLLWLEKKSMRTNKHIDSLQCVGDFKKWWTEWIWISWKTHVNFGSLWNDFNRRCVKASIQFCSLLTNWCYLHSIKGWISFKFEQMQLNDEFRSNLN